jgi:hypothetical protein
MRRRISLNRPGPCLSSGAKRWRSSSCSFVSVRYPCSFGTSRTRLFDSRVAENDAANETLHELGQINAIQFKDVSVVSCVFCLLRGGGNVFFKMVFVPTLRLLEQERHKAREAYVRTLKLLMFYC